MAQWRPGEVKALHSRKLGVWTLSQFLLLGLSSTLGVTLTLGGDINLARGTYVNNVQPFKLLEPAMTGDVVIANLESPLTERPKVTERIDLRAPPTAVTALRPFTHLSTQNNHALDGGEAGLEESMKTLRQAGIMPVSRQVSWKTVQGRKLAFIAYLDDGHTPPPVAEVKRASRLADLVVVLPHWGAEYSGVTLRQRQQARQLVEAGARLVVGSGPHVLQKAEKLNNALVFYSLGNLLFDQPYPRTWPGALIRVTFTLQELKACAIPTFSRAGRVRLATSAERPVVLQNLGLPLCSVGRGEDAAD